MSDALAPATPPAPAPTVDQTATFTQADVDRIAAQTRKDLRDENATLKAALEAANPKLAEFDQFKQAQMTETERAKAEAEAERAKRVELEQRLAARDLDALRVRIGAEKGLDAWHASRLTGTTEGEIRADADEALKHIPAQSGGAPTTTDTSPLTNDRAALQMQYDEAMKRGDSVTATSLKLKMAALPK